jgi:hypothetical protein
MYQDIIEEAYYNPSTGFVGSNKLLITLKRQGHKKIKLDDVKQFLEKQEVYQRNVVPQFASFIPPHPLYQLQVDLVFLENSRLNKAKYGLSAIDVFTKKATMVLMKDKEKKEVKRAMGEVFKILGKPKSVYSDEGSEFIDKTFKKYLKDNGIQSMISKRHASFVERWNRTIKEILDKYLQSTNSKTIINVLPKIIENYNNSYHRTIKMTPEEATLEENEDIAFMNISKKAKRTIKRKPLKKGDKVRYLLKMKMNDKKFKAKWSAHTSEVERINQSPFATYYIVDGREYMRPFLRKVKEARKNPNKADNENTLEGRLQQLAKMDVTEESKQEKADILGYNDEPIAKRLPIRRKTKPKRYQKGGSTILWP